MGTFSATREPAVAGRFYAGDPERLAADIEGCLVASAAPVRGLIRGLVVPHAGYQFSGRIAGSAYALLRGREDVRRVVVLAPSHYVQVAGVSVGNYAAFRTPVGETVVDTVACQQLLEADRVFAADEEAHRQEHALEVQLPFIQTVLPNVQLVPLVCGRLSRSDAQRAGVALADLLWQPDTLWIISSDFTHYGDHFHYVPFRKDVPERLAQLDRGAVERIEALDFNGFLDYVDRTGATICGATPIAIFIAAVASRPVTHLCRMLSYSTSGQLTHEYDHSVSYASILVTDPTADSGRASGAGLAPADKQLLLELARESIHSRLADGAVPASDPDTLSETLQADGAAFVTLHIGDRLRGCIGSLEAREPLYQNVIHNARSAAFGDPRFTALTQEEFGDIELEISVLTVPQSIATLEEFVLGRHGIILEKGPHRAVFLPQVAPEQGWDTETTLTHLSLKAGMGRNAWRKGAHFSVFEAIVFGEKE